MKQPTSGKRPVCLDYKHCDRNWMFWDTWEMQRMQVTIALLAEDQPAAPCVRH